LDPYHLTVLADGTICFTVEGVANVGAGIQAPIQLQRWTHVLGSFDASNGELKLYIDGQLIGKTVTLLKPFAELESGSAGIGIGNVQRASGGAHNQPINGQICDLRLYNRVVTPSEAGIDSKGVWICG
jgi:hypothetical protein